MRNSRTSINTELRSTQRISQESNLISRFEAIISKQQEIIQSLYSEIMLLKSYISLEKNTSPFEANCSDISLNTTVSNESQIRTEVDQTFNSQQYHKLLNRLVELLEIPTSKIITQSLVFQAIQDLQHKLKENQAPVFVERVKEIKVPIIVQKPVERIVYVEKEPKVIEKIVEKPVFREKITEKFIERKGDNEESQSGLNKTYSEKNLRHRKEEDRNYEPRYQQRNRYDSYRKGEFGSNLIKKRGEYTKQYYKRY